MTEPSGSPATFRPARPPDAARLAEVHIASLVEAYRGIDPDEWIASLPEQRAERELRWRTRLDRVPREIVHVAEVAPAGIVGFARGGTAEAPAFGFDGELAAIYLHPDFQRRGVGRELVRRVARSLRERGYRRMLVRVVSAAASRGFYEALGAAEFGSDSVTIGGKELDLTVYGWPDIVVLLEG